MHLHIHNCNILLQWFKIVIYYLTHSPTKKEPRGCKQLRKIRQVSPICSHRDDVSETKCITLNCQHQEVLSRLTIHGIVGITA